MSEKKFLIIFLQEIFPDKPLLNLEKVADKTLDIQQAVEEVLSTETEYGDVHMQASQMIVENLLALILIMKVNLTPISKKQK